MCGVSCDRLPLHLGAPRCLRQGLASVADLWLCLCATCILRQEVLCSAVAIHEAMRPLDKCRICQSASLFVLMLSNFCCQPTSCKGPTLGLVAMLPAWLHAKLSSCLVAQFGSGKSDCLCRSAPRCCCSRTAGSSSGTTTAAAAAGWDVFLADTIPDCLAAAACLTADAVKQLDCTALHVPSLAVHAALHLDCCNTCCCSADCQGVEGLQGLEELNRWLQQQRYVL